MPNAAPLASLTLSRYTGRGAVAGFAKMGSDRAALRGVPGLRFVRLLGTGRGSDLTLGADLRRWARFAVWEDRAAFDAFEAGAFRGRERSLARESYTVLLRPLRWHGLWGGVEPFGEASLTAPPAGDGPLASLTRATIRPAKLAAFWRAVPLSQAGLAEQGGLLASVGLGELPLLHQATFSLWRDAASVKAFAYGGTGHREVIARTRTEGWYREELFARFAVLAAWGAWDGADPLRSINLTGAGG